MILGALPNFGRASQGGIGSTRQVCSFEAAWMGSSKISLRNVTHAWVKDIEAQDGRQYLQKRVKALLESWLNNSLTDEEAVLFDRLVVSGVLTSHLKNNDAVRKLAETYRQLHQSIPDSCLHLAQKPIR